MIVLLVEARAYDDDDIRERREQMGRKVVAFSFSSYIIIITISILVFTRWKEQLLTEFPDYVIQEARATTTGIIRCIHS